MKTTIKKMIRFGLKKDDIKAEFGLNEEQFKRYEAQGRYMEVDNLPELLDKYNSSKILKNDDREKAELFDKLFRMENKDIPNLTIEQKRGMLAAFPHFIEEIKVKVAEEQISKLEEQISTIKEQINKICLENNMAVKYPTTMEIRKEIDAIGETLDGTKYNAFGEIIEEPKQMAVREKKTISITYGDGISRQSPAYTIGKSGMFTIRKKILADLEVGDNIMVYTPEQIYLYEVEKKTISNKVSYARLELIKSLENSEEKQD